MPVGIFLTSIFKGGQIAFDIAVIIFGAVFFLQILQKNGVIANICFRLESFSKDYRIQIIFLAWFFENFIEGTAGFGTPAAIVAPLLVGMGLTPISAAIIALLGNSASVVFGAAGTPIRIGFASLPDIADVPLYTAVINTVGLLVPTFMLLFATNGRPNRKQEFFDALPFALWSGIAFTIPSILSVFLGQEFPSILGSIVGLSVVIITTKLRLFVPKQIIDPHPAKAPEKTLPLLKILAPYGILIGLLVAGKFVSKSFNPGVAFLIASVPTILLFRNYQEIAGVAKLAISRIIKPVLIIFAISTIVQLIINSRLLGIIAGHLTISLLPLITPFLGALGSFLTGSATISNIMFGEFLTILAKNIGQPTAIILALQLVGGAAGNMIAVTDILAAEAVIGLKNKELAIIKGVALPCFIYLLLTGLVGLIIITS